jgi:hypothetical protein
MSRTVKHFSLHRIVVPELHEGIELRIVADVEDGVLALSQVEEAVIRGYARQTRWPHRWVTLFILEDLQPLVRQLRGRTNHSSLSPSEHAIPAETAAFVSARPVINVYDLADLTTCNVFVNRKAMVSHGYWKDPLALQGLLAHEHAHPLAENETTRASRQVGIQIEEDENVRFKAIQVLCGLAEELCLSGPRELFTNEMTIRNDFSKALFHLNMQNVESARRNLTGRGQLVGQLQQEVATGDMSGAAADLLLLLGDLKVYLPLAFEIAPFYRAGRAVEARDLETALETAIFSQLDPLAVEAFSALKRLYMDLKDDLRPQALITWSDEVFSILARVLAEKGLPLRYRLWVNEEE